MQSPNGQALRTSFLKNLEDIASDLIVQFRLEFKREAAQLSSPLLRWLEFRMRYIDSKPREVLKSVAFPMTLPSTVEKGLLDLQKLMSEGGNLNPYQSKTMVQFHDVSGKRRAKRTDFLWADWGIHHLHITDVLLNLHIGVDESEVYSCSIDPPDVIYREAAFEVKEIMDEGRRRHDEVKEARALARKPENRRRFTSGRVIDLRPNDAYQLVLSHLEKFSAKYRLDVKTQTDLLFYINKVNHWFEDGPFPDLGLLASFGWRSVSAVIASNVSIVFQAHGGAPDFLRANVGRVRQRFEPL